VIYLLVILKMKNELLKNNDLIRVVKYKWYKKRSFYIMYIKDIKQLEKYKRYLWHNSFIITKLYLLKDTIKICYKRGYQWINKTKYYINFTEVWVYGFDIFIKKNLTLNNVKCKV